MKNLLVIIALLLVPTLFYASDKPIWVEATGEATLGEMDTPGPE